MFKSFAYLLVLAAAVSATAPSGFAMNGQILYQWSEGPNNLGATTHALPAAQSSTLSATYSNFNVYSGLRLPNPSIKECTLSLAATVPPGFTVGLTRVDTRSTTKLSGATGSTSTVYSCEPLIVVTIIYASVPQTPTVSGGSQKSACGQDTVLTFTTKATLTASSPSDSGMIKVDGFDTALTFSKC
ncbi:hypothetical protein D9611_008836 [Ephemerocybe angulata]|uniref:Uncharacterized protein n=1 Tax=Ephemerocybe angulata TaxID=980116 RepID=A0A8H5BYF1_9AGAR|nr:hypothetical protein D9611_008836 [Tulosesus angulatus]